MSSDARGKHALHRLRQRPLFDLSCLREITTLPFVRRGKMSRAKAQSSPQGAVKAPSEYKVRKNRLARIAVKDSQTMAFLHARGLDVEPKGLAEALRVAIAHIEA